MYRMGNKWTIIQELERSIIAQHVCYVCWYSSLVLLMVLIETRNFKIFERFRAICMHIEHYQLSA